MKSNEPTLDPSSDATADPASPPLIYGADTSTAAFVDFFADGPINRPVLIGEMADLDRFFGGLDARSEASYGVSQFFANGGHRAWIVRTGDGGHASADQLLAALETLDRLMLEGFSLLSLPATANLSPDDAARVHARALAFAARKHALYLLDAPPSVDTVDAMLDWVAGVPNADAAHAAAYFPRLTMPDPLNGNQPRDVGSSGTLAGIYARIASTDGVWRAPAGTETKLLGAEPTTALTELDSQRLTARGVNTLRVRKDARPVVWGARTLAPDTEWRYVQVRRFMSYVEASLEQGLEWAVAEPNDEDLWTAVRQSVHYFLAKEYMRGACDGYLMSEAFFVRCDRTTTSQADVENGVVNVVVGVAPLVPTEFVILRIQLRAGQNVGGG